MRLTIPQGVSTASAGLLGTDEIARGAVGLSSAHAVVVSTAATPKRNTRRTDAGRDTAGMAERRDMVGLLRERDRSSAARVALEERRF